MDIANPMEIIPAPATLPAIITNSGPAAPERFLEFFAANIRNPNTRRAYGRRPELPPAEGSGGGTSGPGLVDVPGG